MRRLNATHDSPTIAITIVPIAKASGAARSVAYAVSETLRGIAAVGAIIDVGRPVAWNGPSFLANMVTLHLLQQ